MENTYQSVFIGGPWAGQTRHLADRCGVVRVMRPLRPLFHDRSMDAAMKPYETDVVEYHRTVSVRDPDASGAIVDFYIPSYMTEGELVYRALMNYAANSAVARSLEENV